ncbi:MAG: hypothetical protein A2X79_06020 [Desulfuromonadaceae bacterium GWB2_53_15]|nr:MAG: hypothetical protein A2X79_06020 [Desulfuromonadaceae bacterium GWB2_53_15]
MKKFSTVSAQFFFALALAATPLIAFQLNGTEAYAQSSYFTSRGCVNCHSTPVVATCAGCHQHSGTLTATKNKTTSYAPGETVTVTLSASGARTGWIGARLYSQTGAEIARSSGNQSGMGGSAIYPVVLSAPAPATAGTYTWRVAYVGNVNGTGSGDVHSEKSVNVSITVASAADTAAPVVSFTLPATATSLTVPVSSLSATDNVAVTGYLVNKSATPPAASATGWTATAPASVIAVAGSNTFYAWAKDAAGNVSAVKSASVTVTTAPATDTTLPALTISSLANGSYTNKVTLNVSGHASDAGGIKSVTVNNQAVTVNADGSFSFALTLVAGANTIKTIATDNAGNQQVDTRTVTYDLNAPVLAVSAPADNSNTIQSFITVTGTVSETSTVSISVNNGSPQSAAITGNTYNATVNLSAGVNTIDITATDQAGNTSSAKRTVTYENSNSKFTLAVVYPAQDITTRSSSLTLKGTVVGASSRVAVRIAMDGRSYSPAVVNGAFQQRLNFYRAKRYSISVTAKDEAGNSSTVYRNVIYRPVRNDDDRDDRDDHDDD